MSLPQQPKRGYTQSAPRIQLSVWQLVAYIVVGLGIITAILAVFGALQLLRVGIIVAGITGLCGALLLHFEICRLHKAYQERIASSESNHKKELAANNSAHREEICAELARERMVLATIDERTELLQRCIKGLRVQLNKAEELLETRRLAILDMESRLDTASAALMENDVFFANQESVIEKLKAQLNSYELELAKLQSEKEENLPDAELLTLPCRIDRNHDELSEAI